MKKIFALLCALLMVFALAGCDAGKEEDMPKQKEDVTVPNVEEISKKVDKAGLKDHLKEAYGLDCEIKDVEVDGDKIGMIWQNPLAGVHVEPGSKIYVYFGVEKTQEEESKEEEKKEEPKEEPKEEEKSKEE